MAENSVDTKMSLMFAEATNEVNETTGSNNPIDIYFKMQEKNDHYNIDRDTFLSHAIVLALKTRMENELQYTIILVGDNRGSVMPHFSPVVTFSYSIQANDGVVSYQESKTMIANDQMNVVHQTTENKSQGEAKAKIEAELANLVTLEQSPNNNVQIVSVNPNNEVVNISVPDHVLAVNLALAQAMSNANESSTNPNSGKPSGPKR